MKELSLFFAQLVPILGSVVLLLLSIALFFIIQTLRKLPNSINTVNSMLSDVEHKLSDLDAPVQAIKTISTSVDTGYRAASSTVSRAIGKTKGTINALRTSVHGFLKKDDQGDQS